MEKSTVGDGLMNYTTTVGSEYNGQPSLRVSTLGSVIYVAVYTPIIVMCIVGNALVLISFIRSKELRKSNNNYYIFALATMDFLTGPIAIPLTISNRLIISDLTCHARSRSLLFLPAFVFCSSSMCILLGITVDRYIAISRPLRYRADMTSTKTIRLVVFWCIFGISFGTIPAWSFGDDPYQWVCELQQYDAPAFTIFALLSSLLIPTWMLLLILAYARIFCIAYLGKNMVSKNRSERSSEVQWNMRMKTTITSAIVLGAFSVCWLPQSFKYIFEIYLATDLRSLLAIQTFCEILAYISSLVNPFIYGWRNPQFKDAYKNILRDWSCRKTEKTSNAH